LQNAETVLGVLRDRGRRGLPCNELFRQLFNPQMYLLAYGRLYSNHGAMTPGVDGETADGMSLAKIGRVIDALRHERFRFQPARRVYIPKKNGTSRPLGMPPWSDKLVGEVIRLLLEAYYEPRFSDHSHGFRPGRGCHTALSEVADKWTGTTWFIEGDISDCFDEIGHVALMNRLRARIKDKRICALVKAFLKAGVMTAIGDREDSLTGTPQGGILSPLLASIALSALDEHFARQWQPDGHQREKRVKKGLGNWRIIRYADDFVIMVHGTRQHAEALREEAAAVLAPLGLRLAEEKTRTVHIDEGFDFLGFTIRRMRKRGTSKHYVYTVPSKKAIQAVKDKIAAKTYRATQNQDLAALIQSVNKTLAGWANYFRHGVSKAAFSAVDSHAWGRIMRWLRRKHQGRTGLGMPELRRRFCAPGTWIFAVNGTRLTGASAVPVTRYRYRGTRIPNPWTPHPATASGQAQRARHAESPVRGDAHAGFGGQAGETHREQSRQGAPA